MNAKEQKAREGEDRINIIVWPNRIGGGGNACLGMAMEN